MSEIQTAHLIIIGWVQGVFYRASAKEVAEKLSITGWIKNTADGNVEALVTGSKEAIQEFISWCKKGPSNARVTDIIITNQETEAFDDFSIIR